MNILSQSAMAILVAISVFSCSKTETTVTRTTDDSPYQPKEYVALKHPDWSKNATIYEVNVRQFTPEGTFKAFESHLPRLKQMGIDIIWLMPINPIGVEKRKGKLGSYYSVKDYYGINPEFGTKEDFKHLVDKIHSMGMHVIVDWVANHSSWDNPLAKDHPDWYSKTPEGHFQPTPWYDWDDVIDFDYDNPELRKYMTGALKYWVKDFDIDGYRCDVAGFIPVDFWENVRYELDQIKPVFMLGEWESRDLHKKAFDMTYSWSLWEKMTAVTRDHKPLAGLVEYMAHDVSTFPRNAYRMTFTDNHDKNSWEGNQYSNFGDGLEAAMVLAGTVNGMPLVYSGQEAGLNRSLQFFDKDLIEWKQHPFAGMYQKLFELKHQNQALWNGANGGEMIRIFNDKPQQVISFSREKNGDQILSIVNFSAQPTTVILDSKYQKGNYKEWFNQTDYKIKGADAFTLAPWKYLVLVKQQ
ncbi:alpha-amylase family glycosyl hydrolase [Flavobacterium sp.]|uniref:alpha-amylase family glycosyl hydrolase n=1 Tax=Flavobacterium sp. TaxID=239 RepID=UPI0039E3E073